MKPLSYYLGAAALSTVLAMSSSANAADYCIRSHNEQYEYRECASTEWQPISIQSFIKGRNKGDKVFFECGGTYADSGTASEPISVGKEGMIIGAYEGGDLNGCTNVPLPVIKFDLEVTAENVTIRDLNIDVKDVKKLDSSQVTAIAIHAEGGKIIGCRVHGSKGYGIRLSAGTSNCTIEKNTCYDNSKSQIIAHHGSDHRIRFNHCYNSTANNANGDGIRLVVPSSAPENVQINAYQIYGNCIASCNNGVSIDLSNHTTAAINNLQIVNNTIVACGHKCISIAVNSSNGSAMGIEMKNNIFHHPSDENRLCYSNVGSSVNVIFSHNLWFPSLPTSQCGDFENDDSGNPQLVGGNWENISAFALWNGSPAIDGGVAIGNFEKMLDCDASSSQNPPVWEIREIVDCKGNGQIEIGADVKCGLNPPELKLLYQQYW